MGPRNDLSPFEEAERVESILERCIRDEIDDELLREARMLDRPDAHAPAATRFVHANVLYRVDRDDEARALLKEAELLARENGDDRSLALTMLRLLEWAARYERWDQDGERVEETVRRTLELGEPYHAIRAYRVRAEFLASWCEFEAAAESYDAAAEAARSEDPATSASLRDCAEWVREAARIQREGVVPTAPGADADNDEREAWMAGFTRYVSSIAVPDRAKAYDEALSLPDVRERGLLLNNRGVTAGLLNEPAQALLFFQKAEAQAEVDGDSSLLNLARANAAVSRIGLQLETEADRELLFSEDVLDHVADGVVRCGRSILAFRAGDPVTAVAEAELALSTGGLTTRLEIGLRDVAARAAHQLGDGARFRTHLDAYEELATDPVELASLGLLLADTAAAEGRHGEASDVLAEVLEMQPQGGGHPIFRLASFYAMLYGAVASEDPRELVEWLETAAPAGNRILAAEAAAAAGRIGGDRTLLLRAGSLYASHGLSFFAADSYDDAARLALHDGDRDEALSHSRRALELLDNLTARSPDDAALLEVQSRSREIRGFQVDMLFEHDPHEAYRRTIEIKSLAFFQLLSSHDRTNESTQLSRTLPTRPPPPMSAPVGSLGVPAMRHGSILPRRELDLVGIKSRHRKRTTYSAAPQLVLSGAGDWRRVANRLDETEAAVEYLIVRGSVLVFVLRHSGLEAVRVSMEANDFLPLIDLIRLFHPGAVAGSVRALGLRLRAGLRRGHALLIEPIVPFLDGVTRLHLAPGSLLDGLPFLALEDASGRALVDTFDVSFLASTGQLAERCNATPEFRAATVIRGRDLESHVLPHLDAECSVIEKQTRQHCDEVLCIGPGHSHRSVRAAVERSQLVHFAGHAGFIPGVGMAAALVTPERLTSAVDLLDWRLSEISLFVLSACESGRTIEHGSDELVGLLRALFAGGVEGVVTSRWPAADEATKSLMVRFYERLLAGGDDPCHALCAAARELRDDGGPGGAWSHPLYWANFTYWGTA